MKKNSFNLILSALLILTALAIGQNIWAMQLFVQRMQTSQTYTFEVEPTDSHEALKAKIQEKLSIDPANQWLVYGDTKLEDGKTLSDYNIQAESTVKLYETSATSGFCGVATVNGGANVTWTYIESSNTLTIGGTGPMTNTFPGSNDPSVTPWGNYRSQIAHVVVEDDVTSIGESAFEECSALTTITIPASVTSIDNSAFLACTKLASVNLLGTTPPALGYSAFGVDPEGPYTARVFNVRSADYFTASRWADIVNKSGDYVDHNNFSMQLIYGLTLAGGATASTPAIVSDASASYYTEGTEVTLGHGAVPLGYSGFAGYTVTAGTLSGEVLTMPAGDVTVTATWTESDELAITANAATLDALASNWCTFYHPSLNYKLPDGAQAFTMKADKGLYLVGDGSEIPAGTPVVIMSDAAAITLTKLDASTMTAESDNILHGTAAETLRTSLITGSQKVYVLGKVGDEFGFYEYTGDTIPANKAYYVE